MPKAGDHSKFEKLGDLAFQQLLPLAESRLKEMHRAQKRGDIDSQNFWGERARAVIGPLVASAKPHRTSEMALLYERYPDWPCRGVLPWIVSKGNTEPHWNLFEKVIHQAKYKEPANDEEWAISGIIKVNPSRAVNLLIPLLSDQKVHQQIRAEIFLNLPGTRLSEALMAVQKNRQGSRMISPLHKRASIPKWQGEEIVVSKQRGRWALIEWSALGSPTDIWVMNLDGKQGPQLFFTGRSNYWPRSSPSNKPVDGFEAFEKEMSAFRNGRSWIDSQELREDTDSDGYSNVVEKWLGLSPAAYDTDGDGIADGIDKNPFAGQSKATDEELAIKAVFDCFAIKKGKPSTTVFVSLPSGIRPIEFTSWPGLVIHIGSEYRQPTRPDALFGVRIKFTEIDMNSSRTMGEVSIIESGSWYMNFLTYEVEKIMGEWFVMKVKHRGSAVS